MKVAIIGTNLAFSTALTSCLHDFEKRGIEIVSINKSEINQNEIDMILPFEFKLQPYVTMASIFDSMPIDELQTISKNKLKYEKSLSGTNIVHNIRNRSKFVQRRHVPTNRGK